MNAKYMFYPESKEFSQADERASAREELRYNVMEDLLVALEDMGIPKKELARRLGKSKSYITQVLRGRNITLNSLSDICFAIGAIPSVSIAYKCATHVRENRHAILWKDISIEKPQDPRKKPIETKSYIQLVIDTPRYEDEAA